MTGITVVHTQYGISLGREDALRYIKLGLYFLRPLTPVNERKRWRSA